MRGNSGYAIAEVLVACVIISISFVELSRAISNIMRSANQTILLGKSISVTHSTMEEVMAQSFDAKGSEAGGYALEFDGIDDYILLSEVIDIGSTSSTVSMWVKVPVVGEGNLIAEEQVGILLGIGRYSPQPNANWEIHDDGQIRIRWNNAEKNLFGSSDLRDGKWHHIAFVRDVDNDSLKGYVDGVVEILENDDGTDISFDHPFYVGNDHRYSHDPDTKHPFHGLIDELQIWDIARTQAQIIADYKTGITNPFNNSNLKLYLRMNNGIGTTVFDHSSNMVHSPITSATWTSQSSSWSTILGIEGEDSWSDYDDVDDFHTIPFTDTDYSQLGGRVYVKYVVVDPTSWAISDAGEDIITDYKQITVKVGIPGSTDSTQLNTIKSAKIIQNYGLTYSPYGN